MRLSVYGRDIEVVLRDRHWQAFYLGPEGKKRLADDITIPAEIAESDLLRYIADLCHEWARPGNDEVQLIE